MNRQMSLGVLGVIAALSASCELPAQPAQTNQVPATLNVPDMAALKDAALSRWPSALSRALRALLFEQIETMTLNHKRLLDEGGIHVRVEQDVSAWSARKCGRKRIPAQDRAILAGILLQTDLLDAALNACDPGQAATLRARRSKHSLRRPNERVFGDARDNVYFGCIDSLHDIAALQLALGLKQSDLELPSFNACGPKGAEGQLLEGMRVLAKRAKLLP